MTKTIPAELQAAFSNARVIEFDDIRKGDVISWLDRGVLRAIGTAARREGNSWRSEADHPLAWNDETNILIHRPKRELPKGHMSIIRLAKSLPGSKGDSVLYARLPISGWAPVGYTGVERPDSAFDGVEWEEVFIAEEEPSE